MTCMAILRLFGGVWLTVLLLQGGSLTATAQLAELEERLVSLFEQNKSAMVRVKAVFPPSEELLQKEGLEPAEGEASVPQLVIGSGFFISREGLILTNASIVYEALRIWVEHNQIDYGAEVVGLDERSNIAFLRTYTLPESFTFFHLSDRSGLPAMGSLVLRLSMPLEFKASPDFGLVSGHESRFGDRFFPCTYIRTTVPAGPGDGGSAYLDLAGRLMGIQVGSLPDVGATYMLPARAALRIRDDILFSGAVTYGWIGFEVEPETSIKSGRRIFLTEVFDGSPAAQAGLLEGDVLKQIGDYPIESLDELRNAMFYTRVGQYVEVTVQRAGDTRRFSIKVESRPDDEPMEIVEPLPPAPPINPLKEKSTEETAPLPFEKDLRQPLTAPEETSRTGLPDIS
jgi:serine protease Do